MSQLREKQILPAVAAAIFNERGEILLQKRRDVGKWSVISGHVEYGESVEEAVLREVLEETGVTGIVSRFIGIYSTPQTQTYDYSDRSVHYITSYFEVMLQSLPDPLFCNEETEALCFFPVNALPSELAQMSEHWLNDALNKTAKTCIR